MPREKNSRAQPAAMPRALDILRSRPGIEDKSFYCQKNFEPKFHLADVEKARRHGHWRDVEAY